MPFPQEHVLLAHPVPSMPACRPSGPAGDAACRIGAAAFAAAVQVAREVQEAAKEASQKLTKGFFTALGGAQQAINSSQLGSKVTTFTKGFGTWLTNMDVQVGRAVTRDNRNLCSAPHLAPGAPLAGTYCGLGAAIYAQRRMPPRCSCPLFPPLARDAPPWPICPRPTVCHAAKPARCGSPHFPLCCHATPPALPCPPRKQPPPPRRARCPSATSRLRR